MLDKLVQVRPSMLSMQTQAVRMTMDWEQLSGSVALATTPSGATVGVELRLLIKPEQGRDLPEPWRKHAHGLLYEDATTSGDDADAS